MWLWDIIRDWFVIYIFGGYSSSSVYYSGGMFGRVFNSDNTSNFIYKINEVKFPIGSDMLIGLGDWLSTTATLLVIIAVCFGLFMLVRYFFRMFSGLLTLK